MFVLFFLGTNVLLAQKKVSGIVKEADTNEPLIGATVVVKGTTNGVITDLDGHTPSKSMRTKYCSLLMWVLRLMKRQ